MSDTEQQDSVPAAAGTVTPAFTDKEQRVLNAAWGCLKTMPEIDMNRLTTAAGFVTRKTCSNTWSGIKKKLNAQIIADGGEIDFGTKKGTKSATKKGKQESSEDGQEDEFEATPSTKKTIGGKATKTPVTPKKRVKQEVADEDEMSDGRDESPTKKPHYNTPRTLDRVEVEQVDINKTVADAAGKMKLSSDETEDQIATEPSTPTPKKARKPAAKKTPAGPCNDEINDEIIVATEPVTPKKRGRKPAAKKAVNMDIDDEDSAPL